jgi:beta-glucosidase
MPAFDDYSMRNRTYKYYEGDPLYPFGHGLTYTTFDYSGLSAPGEYRAGEALAISATISNTGDVAGREVVQVYLTREDRANSSVPMVELVAFDVVELAPGESREVSFEIAPELVGYYDGDGKLVFPDSGAFGVSVGGSQPGFESSNVVTQTVSAVGSGN